MNTLCLKDLRIREQLATAATSDPTSAVPLTTDAHSVVGTSPGSSISNRTSTVPASSSTV